MEPCMYNETLLKDADVRNITINVMPIIMNDFHKPPGISMS